MRANSFSSYRLFAVSGEVARRPSRVLTHPRDTIQSPDCICLSRRACAAARAAWSGAPMKAIPLNHTTFTTLGLPALILSALDKAGFNTPTPIQAKAIPPQLQGRDILGIAQTGSGKTAAFGLPIIAGIAELKGRAEPDDHPRADPRADPRTRGADRGSAAKAERRHAPQHRAGARRRVAQCADPEDRARRRRRHRDARPAQGSARRQARSGSTRRAGWSSTRPTGCSTWASSIR